MSAKATIFNIQRFSLHDGPGIRSTVFLKGCPLRCAWCHNPESMQPGPEPMLDEKRCVICGQCESVCAVGLAGPLQGAEARGYPVPGCTVCGSCVRECPTEARRMVGSEYTVEEVLAELEKDAPYHEASEGGVTFSGGEPLTPGNAPLVLACLEALRARGRHTAVDTCGHVDTDTLLEAARTADLFLYDLKIMDSALHRRATGVPNDRILRNLTLLLETGTDVVVRMPLIPGHTDDRENLNALADFLLAQERVPRLTLLPYHPTGRDKYPRLGRVYELKDVPAMSPEELRDCATAMRARGLEVEI